MINRAPLSLLYINVLIIATCGLIYELLAGTLASYFLGDSVRQFSLIIGGYLSAMGVGAWLSKYIKDKLARYFIEIELAVALIGGTSAPILYFSFAQITWFSLVLYGLVFVIGILVGLELPLLMRIMQSHLDFKDLVSRTLTFDYIGALLASLAFPILFVPHLGLVRTSLIFGIMNALVGLWGTYLLRPILAPKGLAGLRGRAMIVIGLLVVGLIKAEELTRLSEEDTYLHPIVYAETTPYQRIVITRGSHSFQLHLNGNLQFNSADEYRYHEALVHPAFASVSQAKAILVLGGGDGLAIREALKYPGVKSVTLVDIDPAMTRLSKEYPLLGELNGHCFDDSRVRVVNQDAMIWLESNQQSFDVVLIDFPDPSSFSIGKLYTTRFYGLLRERLSPGAVVAVQSTSPLVAPQAYWCIVATLERSGFTVHPYQAAVPSFGIWGYALAGMGPLTPPRKLSDQLDQELRFLDDNALQAMFEMPADLQRVPVKVNRLDSQQLVRYYEVEWSRWNE